MPSHAIVALTLALATFATSCLPGDTRPVPERIDVSVEPGPGLSHGIQTADGWSISFERFLLAIGNAGFDNDVATCNSYAEAHYDRLFDFAVAGREKVGTIYGLGTCHIDFRLRAPSFDAILGPGTKESDLSFMRTQGSDRYAEEARVSVLAIGSAVRGNETKRFEWVFRRTYTIKNCEAEDGGLSTTVTLTTGFSRELRLEVRPEELFRALPDDGAELLFQPMADADANANGLVTLDELSNVPPPMMEAGGQGGSSADAGMDTPASLEALVYEELLPRVLRVAGGGPCEAEGRRSR